MNELKQQIENLFANRLPTDSDLRPTLLIFDDIDDRKDLILKKATATTLTIKEDLNEQTKTTN